MRKIRYSCFVALLLVACIVLASCGVTIDTTMTVDSTGGGFSGTRTMVVTFDADDVEEIEGGIPAVDTIAKTNLPADLTYALASVDESNATMTFTLTFASIDEYRTKVTNILAANAGNELTPVIHYEKQQSIFKEGIKFQENFTSADLLGWFKSAVSAAGIVGEAESNWIDSSSGVLTIDGAEMSNSSQFEVDEQISKCFNRCEIRTKLNTDGSADRTITFFADDDLIETLRTDNEDFDGYMKGVVKSQKGIKVTVNEPDEDTTYTEFVYSFTAKDGKECAKLTNAVMQNENNSLSFSIAAKKGEEGMASVKISEAIDASFYTDDDSRVRSILDLSAFPEFSVSEENVDLDYGQENEREYSPEPGATANITADFKVGYEKVDLKLKGDANKLDAELKFTVSSAFTKDISKIVFSTLEKACKDVDYSLKDNVATVKVSGKPADVQKKLDKMVSAYQEGGEGFCEVKLEELGTASKFTKGTYGSFRLNLTPVIGRNVPVYLTKADGTDIVSSVIYDADGKAYVESDFRVNFTIVNLDIFVIILTIVFGLLILASAGLIFIKRKDIGEMITSFKTMLANRPKKVKPAPGVPVAPYGAPVPPYGAPGAPVQPGAPVPPQYGAPVQPGAVPPQYGAPVQPGAVPPQYGAPVQPGAVPPQYGAPVQPGAVPPQYGAPVQPGAVPPQYGAPVQPGTPVAPGSTEGEVK